MASSNWTYWAWAGSGNTITSDIIRYRGTIWYLNNARQLYVLDEDVQSGESVITTFPSPVDATLAIGWRLFRMQHWMFVFIYTQRVGWAPHLVGYVYNTKNGVTTKVLDPYDQTGYSHSWDEMEGATIQFNSVGFVIGTSVTKVADYAGRRPLLLCSYNGVNWFAGEYDESTPVTGSPTVYASEDYRAIAEQSGVPWRRYCTTDLNIWSNTTNDPFGTTSRFDNKIWTADPINTDLWVFTDDLYATTKQFRNDTGTDELRRINTGGGLFWSCADRGLTYWVPDTNVWQLDYPNTPTANMNIFWLMEGYTGSLFFFSFSYSSGSGRVYKRTTKPGGTATAVGKGSVKLSIDRDNSAVYCTTYGVDTQATDYWRVESDLSNVTLIDKSEASGVYGGVHSAQEAGVHCYGNIYGDGVRRSYDRGVSFSGWAFPSGVADAVEASTLYTKRDSELPDNVVVTVTMSGVSNDTVYGYSGYWVYHSNANFITESQVRRDEHTFIGALEPPSGTVVDYSTDEGISWSRRDTPLPTVTITDLEFA